MRKAFIETVIERARVDERVYLLVGDIGYRLVEPFAAEFPDRFVNVGIAEQDMAGIAAGLALCGKQVFCYSIANFPTVRCLEQIRNDICYQKLDVKIVTAGSGLIYGALGPTHHLTEDLALMRSLPEMTVLAPGDPVEARLATQAAALADGPCYLRLGRTGDPGVYEQEPDFTIGKAIRLREGTDVVLLATGGILPNVVQAADELAVQGIGARVLSLPTLKPLDEQEVLKAARETGVVVTVEEHSTIGGLGSAVAEVLAEAGGGVYFKRLGIPGEFCRTVGNQDYLRELYSLSVRGITDTVKKTLTGEKG